MLLMYSIISSANKGTLLPFQFISCLSLSAVLLLQLTSSTILNRHGENGQTCLVSNFNGIALCFSPFAASCGLDVNCLYFA